MEPQRAPSKAESSDADIRNAAEELGPAFGNEPADGAVSRTEDVVHRSVWVDSTGQQAVEMRVDRGMDGALRLHIRFVGRFAELGAQEGPLGADASGDTVDKAVERMARKLGLRRATSEI